MKKTYEKFGINLKGKIVLAHRGWSSARAKRIYRENSVEACRDSSANKHIGIIELDIRKSRDDILYCYHGNHLEYISLKLSPKTYSSIKQKHGADTLEEVLSAISDTKAVFLDIKDTSITREDVLRVFDGRNFKEVILGHWSVSFLDRFKDMPKNFVKIMNGNIFLNFYDINKLKKDNYKYFEALFPFQIRKKIIEKAEKAGMEFRPASIFFLNARHYWKKMAKYKLKHLSSDFL